MKLHIPTVKFFTCFNYNITLILNIIFLIYSTLYYLLNYLNTKFSLLGAFSIFNFRALRNYKLNHFPSLKLTLANCFIPILQFAIFKIYILINFAYLYLLIIFHGTSLSYRFITFLSLPLLSHPSSLTFRSSSHALFRTTGIFCFLRNQIFILYLYNDRRNIKFSILRALEDRIFSIKRL